MTYIPADLLPELVVPLAYVLMTKPTAYVVGVLMQRLIKVTPETKTTDGAERAGRWIGIFERVIILTFVLLHQYEAIGFLITGKAILRMNSESRTEYVLAGTLLSYMIAILTGAAINVLLGWAA